MNLTNRKFSKWPLLTAMIVLGIGLMIGYFLSIHRPLENDELYSNISSVERTGYIRILQAHILEGNVSPLFYLTQKAFLDLLSFRIPIDWQGEWFIVNLPSQIILRCLPNFFMSLSIALVYYFFARFYSLGFGLYAALTMGASYMTMNYWVMSRPYALLNFLTTAQVLLFLFVMRSDDSEIKKKKSIGYLTLTHLLMAFTATFSAVQVAVVSGFLFLCHKERRISKHVLLTIVPIIVCLVYYSITRVYKFYFLDSPLQLLSASFPKERLAFILVLGFMVVFEVLRKHKGRLWEMIKDARVVYFLFTGVILFLTAMLCVYLMIKTHGKQEGFSISNRYFIYLSPISVIAMALFSAEVWRSLRGQLLNRFILVTALISVLVFRFFWSWRLARAFYGL